MNKFKKIMLATTAFFAFGAVANAADSWSFTKKAIGDNSTGKEFVMIDDDDSNYQKYTKYGFVVRVKNDSDGFTCTDSAGNTSAGYFYGVSTSGKLTKICDYQNLDSSEKKDTYKLKNDEGVRSCVTKAGKTTETCTDIEALAKNGTTTYQIANGETLNNQYAAGYHTFVNLSNDETTTIYTIVKYEKSEATEYAYYDEKGNMISKEWYSVSSYIDGTSYVGAQTAKASGISYTIITANKQIKTITEEQIISASKIKSDTYTIGKIKGYAKDSSTNYYLIPITVSGKTYTYIIDSDAKLVTDELFSSSAELVKYDGGIYVLDDSKYYDLNKKVHTSESDWKTNNSKLVISDSNNKIVVKYDGVTKLTISNRNELLAETFSATFLGETDGKYYFLGTFNPSENQKYVEETGYKNSTLLVLTGDFSSTSETKEVTIKLDSTEKTITVSGTSKLTATTTNTSNSVTWTSSNDKVATVDKDGNVTGVAEGTATITASVDGKSATATITVNAQAGGNGGTGTGTGTGTNNNVENPHTGAAISIVGLVGLAGAGVVINKKKGKKFFHKI